MAGEPVLTFRPVARADEAAFAALPGAERALLSRGATAKRRAEFAAGRAAARAAVDRLLGEKGRCAAVLRAPGGGQPIPVGGDGGSLPAHVSITHADGVAAAAAGAVPVGVDLVRLERLEGAFRREAFRSGELAAWEGLTGERAGGPLAGCAAFAAKEALVKWLGTGLTLPLLALHAAPAGAGRPTRLGALPATGFRLALLAPRRCELPAWLLHLGRYVVVVVARPAAGV